MAPGSMDGSSYKFVERYWFIQTMLISTLHAKNTLKITRKHIYLSQKNKNNNLQDTSNKPTKQTLAERNHHIIPQSTDKLNKKGQSSRSHTPTKVKLSIISREFFYTSQEFTNNLFTQTKLLPPFKKTAENSWHFTAICFNLRDEDFNTEQ
ncbi:hypothetical protein FF38_11354 [Lucilia cuprina]|uniref:Uncharacterized protein n=1 Tax=Lucilia cuprina TaxID=7375 RepID=A0A0L0CU67_LUCCU|nr:hypothetical protein FF38_11354 [Lucilia cuprina]